MTNRPAATTVLHQGHEPPVNWGFISESMVMIEGNDVSQHSGVEMYKLICVGPGYQ